jgi:hypothetical protein
LADWIFLTSVICTTGDGVGRAVMMRLTANGVNMLPGARADERAGETERRELPDHGRGAGMGESARAVVRASSGFDFRHATRLAALRCCAPSQ